MSTSPYMELLTSLMFYASVVALGIKASHYSLMCLIIHIRLCDTEEFPLSVSTNSWEPKLERLFYSPWLKRTPVIIFTRGWKLSHFLLLAFILCCGVLNWSRGQTEGPVGNKALIALQLLYTLNFYLFDPYRLFDPVIYTTEDRRFDPVILKLLWPVACNQSSMLYNTSHTNYGTKVSMATIKITQHKSPGCCEICADHIPVE